MLVFRRDIIHNVSSGVDLPSENASSTRGRDSIPVSQGQSPMEGHQMETPKRTRVDVSKLIDLYGRGHSIRQLSKYFGISSTSVWESLKRHGAPLRNPAKTKEECSFSRDRWAHEKVKYALRRGTLTRSESCEQCHQFGLKLQAHHDDYNKPLDVRWLCLSCHQEWHRNNEPVRELSPESRPRGRGSKPSCLCGVCSRCKNRAAIKRKRDMRRAEQAVAL